MDKQTLKKLTGYNPSLNLNSIAPVLKVGFNVLEMSKHLFQSGILLSREINSEAFWGEKGSVFLEIHINNKLKPFEYIINGYYSKGDNSI